MKPRENRVIRGVRGALIAVVTGIILCGAAHPSRADEIVSFELQNATMDDVQKAMDAGALTSVELALLYLNRSRPTTRTA